jgi:hypothetical protein
VTTQEKTHVGPLIAFAGSSGFQIGDRIADAAEVLEVEPRMLLLLLCRFLDDAGDLLVALLLGH